MLLEKELFKTIVASTPLVSIDLIIRNENSEVLLGKRNNAPAQGFWFVPGGRIFKDESFEDAFLRLTELELGFPTNLNQSHFLGTYQHFYKDNFNDSSFSTQYIVLAYEINLINKHDLPRIQHCEYRWLNEADILNNKEVHLCLS